MFDRIEEKLVKERSGVVVTPINLPKHMGYVISRLLATNPFIYGPRVFNGVGTPEKDTAKDIVVAARQMLTVEGAIEYSRISSISAAAGADGRPDANVKFVLDEEKPGVTPGNLIAARRFYIFGRKQGDIIPFVGAAYRTWAALGETKFPTHGLIKSDGSISDTAHLGRLLDPYALMAAFAPAAAATVHSDDEGTWPGRKGKNGFASIPSGNSRRYGPSLVYMGKTPPVGQNESVTGVGVRISDVNCEKGAEMFTHICNLADRPKVKEDVGMVGGTKGDTGNLWLDVIGHLTWWLDSPKFVGAFGPVIQEVFTDDERKRFTKIEQLEKEAERVAFTNLSFAMTGPLLLCHILLHHMSFEPIKSFIEMTTSGKIRTQLRSKLEQLVALQLPKWSFELLRPLTTAQRQTPWGTLPCVGVDKDFFLDVNVVNPSVFERDDGSREVLKPGSKWFSADATGVGLVEELNRWIPFVNYLHQLFFPVGIQGDKRSFPSVFALVARHLGWVTRGGDSTKALKFDLFNDRVVESDTVSFSAVIDDLDELAVTNTADPEAGYSHNYNVREMGVGVRPGQASVEKVKMVAYRTNQHGMTQSEIVGDVNPLDWVPYVKPPYLLERSETVSLTPESFAKLAGVTVPELAARVERDPAMWGHLFTVRQKADKSLAIEVTSMANEKGELVKPLYAVTSKELIFLNNNAVLITPDLRVSRGVLLQGEYAMDEVVEPKVKLISSLLLPSAAMTAETLSIKDQDRLGVGGAIQS